MVLTILWQVYMFLSAYESIQACQMMEELLGQVMVKLLEAQIHEEPSFGAPYPFAKVVQSMQGKNNGEEENRVKKTEDSSCSLLSHFWRTFRSPFSTCYIPFQISGSQESNASNHVRFGAEMRKIWPSEDNCSRLVRKFRTTPSKFAQPMRGANFPLFLPTPL